MRLWEMRVRHRKRWKAQIFRQKPPPRQRFSLLLPADLILLLLLSLIYSNWVDVSYSEKPEYTSLYYDCFVCLFIGFQSCHFTISSCKDRSWGDWLLIVANKAPEKPESYIFTPVRVNLQCVGHRCPSPETGQLGHTLVEWCFRVETFDEEK